MNGPSEMYHLERPYKLPEKMELPNCMYELKQQDTGSQMPSKENNVLNSIMDKQPTEQVNALEVRWDLVLQQLNELKGQMAMIRSTMNSLTSAPQLNKSNAQFQVLQGAVINANPSSPPYSLLLLQQLYKNQLNLTCTCHTHSSVITLPQDVSHYFSNSGAGDENSIKLKLIWKADLEDTELIINPVKQIPIRGEVNILRYISRLGLDALGYQSNDLLASIQIDSSLDTCHRLLHAKTSKERTSLFRYLNGKLGKNMYLGGVDLNVVDISAWSACKQVQVQPSQDFTQNMAKWYQRVESLIKTN